ncbi:MAG: FixH family protein [Gammaproteobacteria bacterium]|jgi:hypothetical protein|nr:FixH family protein [Gammaproteobacteria bacterium]
MTASHTQRQAPPWYRQFWPWFLIALPATAVAAGIATLIIAASDPDGLVVDDYYKEGLAINQALERDRQAQALGLSGLARLDPAAGRIVVTLNGSGAVARDDALELRLVHPTRPHLDRTLQLTREADDRWSAALDVIAPGRWHVQLESPGGSWRIAGRLALPDQQQALLQPNMD